jgi:hypothetical protein
MATRFIHDWDDPTTFGKQYERAKSTILELPEDEFYFFKAFRRAAFDLQKRLPSFILQMSFVYSYESTIDQTIGRLSLIRNCLLHNSGVPDPKLAKCDPSSFGSGQSIDVTEVTISKAINEFRRAALAVDASFERHGGRLD